MGVRVRKQFGGVMDTFTAFFLLIYILSMPCSMWDLSSLAKDETCAPCNESLES